MNRILEGYINARRQNVGAIEMVDDLLALPLRRALEVGTRQSVGELLEALA